MGTGTVTEQATPVARVQAATIACLGRWGLAKTTLDDIAREAGLSRATVYRLFPGGKDTVVRAAIESEIDAFRAGLADRLEGCTTREDVLVAALTFATDCVRRHEALQYLLTHEPEVVLPHLSFDRFDRVLALAGDVVAPWLEPRVGEWLTRVVLSYARAPSEWFDLGDEADARRFVREFVLRKEAT